jgi:hypothetical protein
MNTDPCINHSVASQLLVWTSQNPPCERLVKRQGKKDEAKCWFGRSDQRIDFLKALQLSIEISAYPVSLIQMQVK